MAYNPTSSNVKSKIGHNRSIMGSELMLSDRKNSVFNKLTLDNDLHKTIDLVDLNKKIHYESKKFEPFGKVSIVTGRSNKSQCTSPKMMSPRESSARFVNMTSETLP